MNGVFSKATKLNDKFVGPPPVQRMVGPSAVELSPPANYRAHPVFNAAAIKRWHTGPSTPNPVPAPEDAHLTDDGIQWIVGGIISTRLRRGQRQWPVVG